MRTEAPLLAPIFRSDGQARLLSTLLLTGDELSITDLAQRAGLAYPTVHREVARLVDAGILSERQVGRTRLIRANDESPMVGPLREILTVATGPVVVLAEELARIHGIESAFLYGSLAARLRYTKSTGQWAIYWRDRNLKFHEYKRKRPTKNVQALLDHIETSGDPIFWG
jgi:DNA-binding transcriptional ArsR family regulator